MDARNRRADTLASAIEINRPVNLKKCLSGFDACNGVVREVTDEEILDAKAQVGAGGFGCDARRAGRSVAPWCKNATSAGEQPAPSDPASSEVPDPDTSSRTRRPRSGTTPMRLGKEEARKLAKRGALWRWPFQNGLIVVDNDLSQILEVIGRVG